MPSSPAASVSRARSDSPALPHVGPQVADRSIRVGHRPQRERARSALVPRLDLLPRARRRHRRAALRAHGVGGGERRAVAVAAGVDVDAAAAVGLAELLRQVLRIALSRAACPTACANRATSPISALAVERHDDVKALRAGRLDPARQAELVEQIAQRRAPRRAARPASSSTDGSRSKTQMSGIVQVRRARRSRRAA